MPPPPSPPPPAHLIVQDVFGHMFGYSAEDVYKPVERGSNNGTPSYHQATGSVTWPIHI